MPKVQRSVLMVSMFLINFVVPRMFGLLPLKHNVDTLYLSRSKLWYIYCLIIAGTYLFVYPVALNHIISSRTENNDSGIAQIVEKLHYCATYILGIAVYIRQLFFTNTVANFINNGIDFYSRAEQLYPNLKAGILEFAIVYIGRAVYSYVGYSLVNYLTLTYFYGELKNANYFYMVLYFLPDIILTSTAIRFHSTIIIQIVVLRRINAAFARCIEQINAGKNKPPLERAKDFTRIANEFDRIAIYYEQIWVFRKSIDYIFSNIILFAILNAFMNLTCVLFFLYIHLVNSDPLHSDYIAYTFFRSSLYSIDLIFIFAPCNKLKREIRKTGLIIHNVFVLDLNERIHRSIQQFSISLLHQRRELWIRGMFSLENSLLYSVIMAITSYLVIFIQFKLDE